MIHSTLFALAISSVTLTATDGYIVKPVEAGVVTKPRIAYLKEEMGVKKQYESSQAQTQFGVGRNLKRAWRDLSQKAKDDVKQWFIERGNKKGVPFAQSIAFHREHRDVLEKNFVELINPAIKYDDYYIQTFHGYEEGNLNWESAEDCLPATLSMSLSYWPHTKPTETQSWFRGNYTEAIRDVSDVSPARILDIGSSVGVGTKFLLDAFPEAEVSLLDLSPHFLASAKMFLETPKSPLFDKSAKERVSYHHGCAEKTSFEDGSFDAISVQFVFHELPSDAAEKVVRECYRLLRPGGTLAILDLDPETVRSLPHLRRLLFEVSEPHIHDFTRRTNILELMDTAGFENTRHQKNDPMNARWIGQKPQMEQSNDRIKLKTWLIRSESAFI